MCVCNCVLYFFGSSCFSLLFFSFWLQSLSGFICVVIIIIFIFLFFYFTDAVFVYRLLSQYFTVNVLVISSIVATADM